MKILKFGAVWCPGCLVMRPIFKQIESEMPDLKTEYFDYDMDEETINKWDVGKILPVFIFLDEKDSEILRLIGEQKKAKLVELINEHKNK